MNDSIWKVQQAQDSDYLESILKFLLPEFGRIFGEKTMFNEECIIFNNQQADCPMLITNSFSLKIRLAQKSLSCWAQTIFQLSHELCHYAIRQSKIDKDFTLSWFEEIVCEAMSLYLLHWSAEHWERCELFIFNPDFRNNIGDYLNHELKKTGTDEFQKCTTIEKLKNYDAEERRETHRNERNSLYFEILKNPLMCRIVCKYQTYVDSNRITIDFEEWEKHSANPLIRFLHKLQPCSKEDLF